MKKRSANLETIIDALESGKTKKLKYRYSNSLGLPYSIGKPFFENLIEMGLMKTDKDKNLFTSKEGLKYLNDLIELNRKYGVDSVLNSFLESKNKYYESRKPATY